MMVVPRHKSTKLHKECPHSSKLGMKSIFRKLRNSLFVVSLLSLFWFLLRTGTRPSRIMYPCQKAAAAQFTSYFVYVFPFLNIDRVVHFFKYKFEWKKVYKTLALVLVLFMLVSVASFFYD